MKFGLDHFILIVEICMLLGLIGCRELEDTHPLKERASVCVFKVMQARLD